MMMMEQLPFPVYTGKAQTIDYTLPEDLQAFDALAPSLEQAPITIIPAHETVRLMTVSNYGAIIYRKQVVGKI